ncbi:MAG: hypothetical protein AAF483_02770 [Planctomycetota bacterium]
MDNRLQIRLKTVASRIRSLHLGWTLAGIWLLAAVIGLVLSSGKADGTLQSENIHWLWLGASGLVALIATIVISRRNRNLSQIAERVEHRFPSCTQSLITAAGIRPEKNGRFGFLQRSVISEALRHDVTYHWKSVVSGLATRTSSRSC